MMRVLIIVLFATCLSLLAFQPGPAPTIEPLKIPVEQKTKLTVIDSAQVLVVNMIPNDRSEEYGQDSEPFLAVSPNKLMIAAVYYGESMEGKTSPPLFLSTDKGESWQMIFIIPAKGIGSQTYCFSGNGTSFYGSILAFDKGPVVSVFHTTDPNNNSPLQNISTLGSGEQQFADQPFIQVRSADVPSNNANSANGVQRLDRIYVGQNYFGKELGKGKTASVRVSVDNGITFRLLGVEARDTGTAGQDSPEVRPALANDETVYVGFTHWKAKTGNRFLGDVVVSRDDQAAAGTNSFLSLIEPEDGLPGRIVAKDREFSLDAKLGQQRVGSGLSLAVDPKQSGTVYLAWVDYDRTQNSVIHIKRSTDRGQNWSNELLTIPSATNPALAISDRGEVGLLYQQLYKDRWDTHFRSSEDGIQWSDIVLSSFPTAVEPEQRYDPYLGDKVYLLSVNGAFYGVFSAPNIPEQKYFPQGVKFQRNYSDGKLLSQDGNSVPASIDPYFFRVGAESKLATPSPSAAAENIELSSEGLIRATSYRWVLLGASLVIGFIAIVTVVQAYRAPRKVDQLLRQQIQQQIQGPTLTNYTGFVTARFTDLDGVANSEVSAGQLVQMTVGFGQDEPNEEWAEKIDLRGGEDAREVLFSIVIDSPDFAVTPDHSTAAVPVKGPSKVAFTVRVSPNSKDATIFIQLYQKTRLIHVLTPKLSIHQVRTNRERGDSKSSEIAD